MHRLLLLCLLITGCSPVIDAQLRLLDAARKGLAEVGQSLDDRQRAMAALEAAERRRLDAAFDTDVKTQSALTDAWVIEARTAYAALLDAFARRRQQSERATAADQANLAAVDAALQQLQALGRAQLRLMPEELK
ncbi:MAG TPA: hypothetical protein VF595_15085 [Tepidisphaeraceae bacterium]|jgi:hypothetical protein